MNKELHEKLLNLGVKLQKSGDKLEDFWIGDVSWYEFEGRKLEYQPAQYMGSGGYPFRYHERWRLDFKNGLVNTYGDVFLAIRDFLCDSKTYSSPMGDVLIRRMVCEETYEKFTYSLHLPTDLSLTCDVPEPLLVDVFNDVFPPSVLFDFLEDNDVIRK